MGRAANRALLLRPAERVQAERRPVILRVAAGWNLLAKPQQVQVAARVRTKAADFDVVAKEIRIAGNLIHLPAEELFLKIEARPPRQIAAHLRFSKTILLR